MKLKRGTISKLLGVYTEGELNKAMCLEKVRILKAGLKKNKYKGKLLKYAKYYANWYKWRATHNRSKSA